MTALPDNREDIKQKLKEFLQSNQWKNSLIFLIFVALAFSFWLLQYYQQKFDVEISVPVQYINIPADIVLTENPPKEISLRISDKGTVLLNYSLRKKKTPIVIDVEKIIPDNSTYLIDQSALFDIIRERLQNTSELKTFTPGRIVIYYAPLDHKELPIVVTGNLIPAPGYMLSDSIRPNPATVTAYSDSKTLDSLSYIKTDSFDKKNINKDFNFSVSLIAPPKIRLSETETDISVKVEEFTEKVFEIPISCTNLPKDRIVRFFPSEVQVYVQTGLSKYSVITKADFEIKVDYSDLFNNHSENIHIGLTKQPEDLISYRLMPDIVQFIIEQKNNP